MIVLVGEHHALSKLVFDSEKFSIRTPLSLNS